MLCIRHFCSTFARVVLLNLIVVTHSPSTLYMYSGRDPQFVSDKWPLDFGNVGTCIWSVSPSVNSIFWFNSSILPLPTPDRLKILLFQCAHVLRSVDRFIRKPVAKILYLTSLWRRKRRISYYYYCMSYSPQIG